MEKIKNINWKFTGTTDEAFRFVEGFHLTDDIQWRRFVEQFRIHSDIEDNGWKGEFWGKMMRGASMVYEYTKNEKLYSTLAKTVRDMIDSADELGRISTYSVEKEFNGWDIWCRKYVMLGMEYFLEICKDEQLRADIIHSLRLQADYLISKIGPEEDKRNIAECAIFWRGLSASSILEPIARLYQLTGEDSYLQFAEYIVECGGSSVGNIFRLAYENNIYPYQYPVTKAYEMISCFEGLLALYRETGTQWYKEAAVNFADKLLESDFTIIGSCGCSGELLDHSTVRQANTNNEEIMQETCVTVTLMKYMYQLTLLTFNPKYVDAFERAYYNAYLGALNTEKNIGIDVTKIYNGAYKDAIPEALPFDSYSPLVAGTRGNGIGGVRMMPDFHYYGCCACIGSAGVGLVPMMTLMKSNAGFVINMFISGEMSTVTPIGQNISFLVDTDYPKNGEIKITIKLENPEKFAIALRNPQWSESTSLMVNGEFKDVSAGYAEVEQTWNDGDEIVYCLDMRTQVIRPISYGSQLIMTDMLWEYDYVVAKYDVEDPAAKEHIALRRGPVILAAENRLGYSVDDAFDIKIRDDGYVDAFLMEDGIAPYNNILEMEIPLNNNEKMHMTDYASAGKLWNEESKMAAWIRLKA